MTQASEPGFEPTATCPLARPRQDSREGVCGGVREAEGKAKPSLPPRRGYEMEPPPGRARIHQAADPGTPALCGA